MKRTIRDGVLQTLEEDGGMWTIEELKDDLGASYDFVRRVVMELCGEGLLVRDENEENRYGLVEATLPAGWFEHSDFTLVHFFAVGRRRSMCFNPRRRPDMKPARPEARRCQKCQVAHDEAIAEAKVTPADRMERVGLNRRDAEVIGGQFPDVVASWMNGDFGHHEDPHALLNTLAYFLIKRDTARFLWRSAAKRAGKKRSVAALKLLLWRMKIPVPEDMKPGYFPTVKAMGAILKAK